MTQSPSHDSAKQVEISDERFAELLDVVVLADDLRQGIGKPIELILEALYIKLDYAPVAGIEDFLDLLKEELNEKLQALLQSVLDVTEVETLRDTSDPGQQAVKEKFARVVAATPKTKQLFTCIGKAKRSLGKFLEIFTASQDDEKEELAELLLGVISDFNKLRVTHDVVPLMERGLYASQVKQARDFWIRNFDDEVVSGDESAWQKELGQRIEVLQRALGGKVVLLHAQAHVGTDGLDGKGDRITDFLLNHADTRNVFFVEIKTPQTALLGNKYRSTFPLSSELSGAISQVLLQRNDLMTNYFMKSKKSEVDFSVAAPRCIIIAGRIDKELGTDKAKHAAFEMQRQAVEPAVRLIAFDELYEDFATFHQLD